MFLQFEAQFKVVGTYFPTPNTVNVMEGQRLTGRPTLLLLYFFALGTLGFFQ